MGEMVVFFGVHHSLPFFFSWLLFLLFLWVAGCIRLIDAVEEWNWTGSDWIVKQISEQMDGSEGSWSARYLITIYSTGILKDFIGLICSNSALFIIS